MGILEEIKREIASLHRKVDAIGKRIDKNRSERKSKESPHEGCISARKIAERYSIARPTVNLWLERMADAGYSVEVHRIGDKGFRYINAEQFDRAFLALTNGKETAA